jgi:uncharacterized protein
LTTTSLADRRGRLGWLIDRRDGRDFPYYDGEPVDVAAWKWLLIILGCAVGFFVLISIPSDTNVEGLLSRALFPAIMLAVFIPLTGRYWSAIFHILTKGDWLNMVVLGLLTIVISFLVGFVIRAIFDSSANTAADGVASGGPVVRTIETLERRIRTRILRGEGFAQGHGESVEQIATRDAEQRATPEEQVGGFCSNSPT